MISLIVPVYNGERFLRACADSILNQSMREIEFIFVDDGSTDGSREILKEYARKDARVRVIAQENRACRRRATAASRKRKANISGFSTATTCCWRADMIRKSRLQYPPYHIEEDVGFYLCALGFFVVSGAGGHHDAGAGV